jgi:DNA-binding transcriptional MerR regulator
MEKSVSTGALCAALGLSRTRIDRWISDGDFTPSDQPESGKARRWSEQDAARIECLFRLADAGVSVKVGRAISHVYTHWQEATYLVVLAHEVNLVRREMRGTKYQQIDLGHPYIAHCVAREKLPEYLQNWGKHRVTAAFFVDLDEVREKIERAFKTAIRLDAEG